MSLRFLLTCPDCQHANEVTTTQAGQEIACTQCQAAMQAPRLGELKQLPVASDQALPDVAKTNKGGGLFVFGLLLFLLGAGGGTGLYFYGAQKLVPYDVQQYIEDTSETIDELGINDLVGIYSELPVDQGLGQWRERSYVSSNKQGEILIQISYGLMGIGVVGLIMMLIGIFR
jgi:ribosomal protein S27E